MGIITLLTGFPPIDIEEVRMDMASGLFVKAVALLRIFGDFFYSQGSCNFFLYTKKRKKVGLARAYLAGWLAN